MSSGCKCAEYSALILGPFFSLGLLLLNRGSNSRLQSLLGGKVNLLCCVVMTGTKDRRLCWAFPWKRKSLCLYLIENTTLNAESYTWNEWYQTLMVPNWQRENDWMLPWVQQINLSTNQKLNSQTIQMLKKKKSWQADVNAAFAKLTSDPPPSIVEQVLFICEWLGYPTIYWLH